MSLSSPRQARVRSTQFFQGRTVRWGLAWTFALSPPTKTKSVTVRDVSCDDAKDRAVEFLTARGWSLHAPSSPLVLSCGEATARVNAHDAGAGVSVEVTLENSTEAQALLDAMPGHVTRTNRWWRRKLGRSVEDVADADSQGSKRPRQGD